MLQRARLLLFMAGAILCWIGGTEWALVVVGLLVVLFFGFVGLQEVVVGPHSLEVLVDL